MFLMGWSHYMHQFLWLYTTADHRSTLYSFAKSANLALPAIEMDLLSSLSLHLRLAITPEVLHGYGSVVHTEIPNPGVSIVPSIVVLTQNRQEKGEYCAGAYIIWIWYTWYSSINRLLCAFPPPAQLAAAAAAHRDNR